MENKEIPGAFEEFETYESFTDQEIFVKIWTEPRRILRYINETKYEKFFYILLYLAGVSAAFDRATSKNLGDKTSVYAIIVGALILGGFLGWISYYIYAALLNWTGKWLDAKGDTKAIYRILAYAMIPSVVSLIFLVPQIAIFGNNIFKEDADLLHAGTIRTIVFWISVILEITLGVFTIIFSVIGISEVQKLSIWKSILNLILPVIVFVGPILIIVLLVSLSRN